ncbi:MAG: DUF3095 domain-containing protein [Oscillatoriales cyanobacterium SM2_2_1]|nr:DUF3095 domain-containing protein [Oscillatoriales cyanobacterium SM2_2_1]
MDAPNFYAALPPMRRLRQIVDDEFFAPVPPDWWIVISDVVNSTQHIEAGLYKEVNLMGASTIVALLNLTPNHELPFVFGGDGATVLIPDALREQAAAALLSVQSMAAVSFNLDLRVGMVPMSAVAKPIWVGKLAISEHYNQAVFKGGGVTAATDLIKDGERRDSYQPQLPRGSTHCRSNWVGVSLAGDRQSLCRKCEFDCDWHHANGNRK